jgi:hypothetical protein
MAQSSSKATTSRPDLEGEYRHWSADSEAYAPADVLLQHLRAGWKLDELVAIETFYYAGYRRSDIYYFTLQKDGKTIEMPVLANPTVFRIVKERGLTTVRISLDPQNVS